VHKPRPKPLNPPLRCLTQLSHNTSEILNPSIAPSGFGVWHCGEGSCLRIIGRGKLRGRGRPAYRKKDNIATANTQFEPWREGEHDDLLFALCLAGWAWRSFELKYRSADHSSEPVTPPPAGRTPLTGESFPPLP
jgi:hypothetical protein